MLNCTYIINGNPYSYDSLWSALDESDLNDINSVEDILYSKYPKQEAQIKLINELKAKSRESRNNNIVFGDVSEEGENGEVSVSQFLTQSPDAIVNGRPIVVQMNIEDYRKNEVNNRTKNLGMDSQAAIEEVEREIQHWDITAEDSKILHKLVTDPIISSPEDLVDKYISKVKAIIPKDSRLNNDELLKKLYIGLKEFYLKNKSHYVNSETLRNINLVSTLKNYNQKLFGHIDYAFVDQFGALHIYNFKVTNQPINKWSENKKNTYKYELAFIKQMLANNGLNIKDITMHVVPLQVQYSSDFSEINNITVREVKNYGGNKYDNTARYFIDSNTQVENITQDNITSADSINRAIFPFFNVKSDVIGKSVDDWIRNAPTVGEDEPLIIRQNDLGEWEVFINGKLHRISDPTSDKSRNKEIIQLVSKHIDELISDSSYIATIRNYVLDSFRRGYTNSDGLKTNGPYFNSIFRNYVLERKDPKTDKKYRDWELIDDLVECNIFLFRNKKTGIIDVVTLSQQNLNVVPKYPKKGATNILGAYKLDSQTNMMYGDMGGIEAIRTMVLLNQIINKIPNAKFGNIKIVSQLGNKKIYSTKDIADKYLKEIFKTIKSEVRDLPEFSFNFKNSNFSDPVDDIIREYHSILDNNSETYGKYFSETLGLENLESAQDREQKRIALYDIAKMLQRHFMKGGKEASPEYIANNPGNNDPIDVDMAKLYLLVTDAYLAYSGEHLEYNSPMSELHTFVTTAPTVSSSNVRIVVNNLQTTLDNISEEIENEYTKHMRSFLMEFYKDSGYTSLENITIGDQNRLFKNLYATDSDGKRILRFKNPYINESDNNYLTKAERTFLKKALFEFNRIRQIRRNDIKQFTSWTDPRIAEYISTNPNGEQYLWVPLKRASKSSQRQNIKSYTNNFKRKLQQFIKMNGQQVFDELVNDLTPEEREVLDQDINDLSIHNPMLEWEKSPTVRQDKINKLGVDYFETNVEDILLNFLARSVEVEKFQRFLVGTKMLLLKLDMMGDDEALKTEKEYIENYIKVNVFQKSIMSNQAQNIVGTLTPVRTFVSYANLAGNMVAYLRDIENGFFENFLRTVTKFQTDINAQNLSKAYGYVVTHGTANTMNINMLSKLCVRYRLSNTDLARITERLKTNRGGIYNWDNWAFATLRSPDFLNRMTLFVAKAMQDGCFDAWYIENDELKYNWKKDKRFEIYAKGDKSNPEYSKQKALYILKIKEWNQEHPEGIQDEDGNRRSLSYEDDLPTPYSNQEILSIKNVSNNIYGSYDRSLRAMGENKALGWAFGMYTTWMNGMWNNYFMKPGEYNIHQMRTEVETDENGNELWLDEYGNVIIQLIDENGNKTYINQETGEVAKPDVPILKHIPVIVQGIYYTFKDIFNVFTGEGLEATKAYLKGNDVAKKNIRKFSYDLLAVLLHLLLLMFAKEAYTDHKKHAKEYSLATNLMSELGYKAFKQAGDSFRGLYNIVDYVGDSDPPIYKVPTKLILDTGKFVFGDKSFQQLITGNFAIARAYKDTAKLYENSK